MATNVAWGCCCREALNEGVAVVVVEAAVVVGGTGGGSEGVGSSVVGFTDVFVRWPVVTCLKAFGTVLGTLEASWTATVHLSQPPMSKVGRWVGPHARSCWMGLRSPVNVINAMGGV